MTCVLPLGSILFAHSFYSTNSEHVVDQTSYQKLGVHVWIMSSGTRLWAAFWKKSVSAETRNTGGVVSLTRLEKERFRRLGPHGQRLREEGEEVLRNVKGMRRVGDVRQSD